MSLFGWLTRFFDQRRRNTRRDAAKRWHERLQTQPAASALEPRRVLNAAPVVPVAPPAPPAEVIIHAGQFDNDGQADTFTISHNASGMTVTVNGQFQQTVDSSQRLVIQGSQDSDSVRIDTAHGGQFLGDIQFQGNGGTDSLQLEGTAQSVTHSFSQDGSSTIRIDGGSLTHSSGVTVTDLVQATERTFCTEDAHVSDAEGAGLQRIEGQYGQQVVFSATSAVLAFDSTNAAADQLQFDGLDAKFQGDLIIQGDANDQVRISGQISLGAGDLTVKAGTIAINSEIETSSAVVRLDATLELTIEAGSRIVNSSGTIIADAGATGTLTVSGLLDVSNLQPGQTGGTIHLLGHEVGLLGADVDARGDTHGGTILVGGDFQGKNPNIRNASYTAVDRHSQLNASAGTNGSGGKIIVWSDLVTRFAGNILAVGGTQSGNGGTAEVSGQSLHFQGFVNLSATQGKSGTLLLDPKNITIADGGVDPIAGNETFGENAASDATFDADLVTAILNTGTNLTLQANNDITINEAILVNNGSGDGGDLILQAGRSVTINADITTDDGDFLATANETLANGVIDANRDAGTAVIAMAAAATINAGAGTVNLHLSTGAGLTNHDSGDITLTNLTAGALIVTNDLGQIMDNAGGALSVTNNATFNATAIALDNAASHNFGTLTLNSTGAVTIVENSDLNLTGANTAGTLSLTSSASITENAGASLAVTGLTSLTATNDITINQTTNNFGGRVNASGVNIALRDTNDIQLGNVTATGTLGVTAGSSITQAAATTVAVTGATTLTATNNISVNLVTNNFGGQVNASGVNIALRDGNSIQLGDVTASGTLAITSGINITQAAATNVTATGTTTLTAANHITVTQATNDFAGQVNASGVNIAIRDANDIQLGNVTATGTLGVTAGSSITQAAATTVAATGASTLTATNNITVNQASNNFVGQVNASGVNVALRDINSIQLGNIVATGTLTVTSGGSITQATEAFSVTGAATLTANNNITLNQATNNFSGQVNASGINIALRDANDIQLGNVTATGTLGVTADGSITQAAATTVSVNGVSTLTATDDITVNQTTNNFASQVNASGVNIALRDANDIQLGDVTAIGTLGVIAGGSITQAAATTVAVTGATTLLAANNITVDQATNDFVGQVDANGAAITLRDANDIQLGNVTATGNVLVTAGGDIAQATGTVSGNILRLIAGGSIGTSAQRLQADVKQVAASANGNIYLTVNDSNNDGVIVGAGDGGGDGLAGLTTTAAAGVIDFAEVSTAPGGGITITEAVSAAGGGVLIRAASPLTVNADVTDNGGGNILLAAEGASATDDLTINAQVTASGGNGNIQLFAGDSYIQQATRIVSAAGVGTITIRAGTDYNNGSIQNGTAGGVISMASTAEVRSEDGTLTLLAPGDVTLAVLNANSDGDALLGDVIITADDTQSDNVGAILDANGAVLNVTANGLAMSAATGIGAATDRIEISVATVAAMNTTANGISLEQVAAGGNLVVGTVNGVIGLDSSTATAGDISVLVNNGTLSLENEIDAGDDVVRLRASGDITQSAGIIASELGVVSVTGSIDLSLAANNVTEFAAQATAANQSVNYQDADSVRIDQVADDAGAVLGGNLNGIQVHAGSGIVRLQAVDDIEQAAAIQAHQLGALVENGHICLTSPDNAVSEFAAQAQTEIGFNNSLAFLVTTVQNGGGPMTDRMFNTATGDLVGITTNDTNGTVVLQSVGSITQDQQIVTHNLGVYSSTGSILLENPGNDVRVFSAQGSADIHLVTQGDVQVGLVTSNCPAVPGPGLLFAPPPAGINPVPGPGAAPDVCLQADGDITQADGSPIIANTLGAVSINGLVDLSYLANDVNVFAAQASTDVNFQNLDGFEIGTTDCATGITAGNTVGLQARSGDITQTAVIVADSLGAMANTGSVDLSLASNDINTFAAQAVDQVNFQDADEFSVGTVAAGGSTPVRMFDNYTSATPAVIDLNGIQGVDSSSVATVRLQALTGNITQTADGAILATELGANAVTGDVALCTADNDVSEFAARGNSVSFRDANSFVIGTVLQGGGPANDRLFDVGVPGQDLVNITAPQNIDLIAGQALILNVALNSQTVRLVSETAHVTQNAGVTVTATNLAAQAGTYVDLSLADNDVNVFAASAGDYVYFQDVPTSGQLTIGTAAAHACVAETIGITANQNLTSGNSNVEILVENGDLLIDQPIAILDNDSTVVNPQQTVRLWTNVGSATQTATGAIAADRLSVNASGNDQTIDLSLATNDVRAFAATAEKEITLLNQGPLTITQITGGAVVTPGIDGVTSTDNGAIKVITRNKSGADGDLSVQSSVNSDAAITLVAQDSVTLNANIGNAATETVTIVAQQNQITRQTTGIVTATDVNLIAAVNVGTGALGLSVLQQQQGIDDWNAVVLNGNANAVVVQTTTLTVAGAANGNPLDPLANPTPNSSVPVGNDVYLDVSPLAGGTIEIQPFLAGNDVVITSEMALPAGTVQLNGIETLNHILVHTDADNIIIGGDLTSATTGTNTIALQAGGTLTKPDSNVAITTGNMRLLQLIPNAIHENIDGSPFNASNNDQLQNNIYADYNSFQVVPPFLSPNEALIRPGEENSILATYGTDTEYGWNIGIDWGDGSPPSNLPPDQPRTNGSIAADATTPLSVPHFYQLTTDATYDVNLTVSVDPSISLRADGGATRYETQTLRTNVQVSVQIPPPSFFMRPEAPPPTPIQPTPLPVLVASQPMLVVPEEIKLTEDAVLAPEQIIYLRLYRIPEEAGLEPEIVKEPMIAGMDTEGRLRLNVLTEDRLLDFLKSQPDGRYRLMMFRAIRIGTDYDDFDERTVLETIIKDHVPTNPIEETIERLQRQLNSSGESSDVDEQDAGSARHDATPWPAELEASPMTRESEMSSGGRGWTDQREGSPGESRENWNFAEAAPASVNRSI